MISRVIGAGLTGRNIEGQIWSLRRGLLVIKRAGGIVDSQDAGQRCCCAVALRETRNGGSIGQIAQEKINPPRIARFQCNPALAV